ETYRKYERGYRRLQEFMKETYNITDIALRELSYEFIVDYESYLRRVSKCGVNTTAKFIQTLRMIVLYAKNNGMIFKDPFLNYKVKKEEVDRGYLTTDELDRIASKVIPIPRLDHVRDMFLFACFTGLAYIDVANLMESDIKEAFDGSKWIMTHRQKTGVAVNVPLLDYPRCV
ncbi:site-specific integrase, partial [Muribaculum intestinale]|uniref:site-specific integrase n=1 Tax=Muribaculum intestinale TaxID=1796646 RepID=UPI0025A67ECF